MLKIKEFFNEKEEVINEWLEDTDIDIIDIKYSVTDTGSGILILYDD